MDRRYKFIVYKTFRRCSGHLLNVLFTFNLCLVSRAFLMIHLRDDTHMTAMKIAPFLWPCTPLVHLRPTFFHSLDYGRPTSNFDITLPPSPSPNNNQSIKRKHNPRMTIVCYQVFPSGWLSFSIPNFLFLLFT